MGDTWGISGPVFLVGYGALAAIVLILVISALTALRLRDAIRSTRGTAQAVPGVALVADDLECAVYRALMTPRNRRSLRGYPGVAAALDRAADRLTRAGLLLSSAHPRAAELSAELACIAGAVARGAA